MPACRLLQNHFQSTHAGAVVDFFVDGEQRQFVLRGSRHDGAVARIAVVPVERSKNAGSLTPSDPEGQAKGGKLCTMHLDVDAAERTQPKGSGFGFWGERVKRRQLLTPNKANSSTGHLT